MNGTTCQRRLGSTRCFREREKHGLGACAERDLPDGKSPGFLRVAGCEQRRKFFPQPPRGATHASHGLAREGQPWAVSRRSLRNWVHGRSRNTLSIESPPALASPVHE